MASIHHHGFTFYAHGDRGTKSATGATARAAALAFLEANPTKRKPFDVYLVQDYAEGEYTYYRHFFGSPAWKNTTRKTAPSLPDTAASMDPATDLDKWNARYASAPFVFCHHYGRI